MRPPVRMFVGEPSNTSLDSPLPDSCPDLNVPYWIGGWMVIDVGPLVRRLGNRSPIKSLRLATSLQAVLQDMPRASGRLDHITPTLTASHRFSAPIAGSRY